MVNTIQYDAADAVTLVQMAALANGDLSQVENLLPTIPVGPWRLLKTFSAGGVDNPQGILVAGSLPSDGNPATILAVGFRIPDFLTYYTSDLHRLSACVIPGLLPSLSATGGKPQADRASGEESAAIRASVPALLAGLHRLLHGGSVTEAADAARIHAAVLHAAAGRAREHGAGLSEMAAAFAAAADARDPADEAWARLFAPMTGAPPMSLAAIDTGYQGSYMNLQPLIAGVLSQYGENPARLVVCGLGQGGPLAQLAAGDFRPKGKRTPSSVTDVAGYSFSTPNFVNKLLIDAMAPVQAQVPLYNVTATGIDFYPSAPPPAPGFYQPWGTLLTPSNAKIPAYDSPWYERSAEYYAGALVSAPPVSAAPTAPTAEAGTSGRTGAGEEPGHPRVRAYDAGIAYSLSRFSAAAYQAFQHPNLDPSLPSGWNPAGRFSSADGRTMGCLYTNGNTLVVAFRGPVSFDETVQVYGNYGAQYLNFLPADQMWKAGTFPGSLVALYTGFRDSLRSALAQVSNLGGMTLLFTGHDAGGGLATLCAADLMVGNATAATSLPVPSVPPTLYTFGAPPFLSQRFYEYLQGTIGSPLYLVRRPADTVATMFSAGFFLPGAPVVGLPGLTQFDGETAHPVIGYVSLLNPHM